MNPANLDDRLRAALHDLDARTVAHAGRTHRATAPPRSRARVLVPVLAAVAVAAVLVAATVALRPPDRGTRPATGVTTGPAPQRTAPSQTGADAERDGIYPQIAALPTAARLSGSSPIRLPEGSWAISEPNLSLLTLDEDGCLPRTERDPAYRVCNGYAEVLLIGPEGILRAYPFPEFTPAWSEVTDDAFYCGRAGDGGVPQNTLCRIDRETLELTGRVYACDGPDCAPWDEDELAGWPGDWSQSLKPFDEPFLSLDTRSGDLNVLNEEGGVVAVVNALTLREL